MCLLQIQQHNSRKRDELTNDNFLDFRRTNPNWENPNIQEHRKPKPFPQGLRWDFEPEREVKAR